jgi:hypothetical protein
LVHFVFILCIFSCFWYHVPRKIWQPCLGVILSCRNIGKMDSLGTLCDLPTLHTYFSLWD